LLDLIIKRKISAPKIYLEIRVNVLKGVTLFFAISEAHEANAKKGLEIAKEKAFFLGAKIFREFKENDFVGKNNTFLITVGRRKIKSILIA
jgi:RNA polymerase II subunit A-like phosphatase